MINSSYTPYGYKIIYDLRPIVNEGSTGAKKSAMPDLHFTTQITAVPHIVDERCKACRKCVARQVCKSKAIIQVEPGEPPFIDGSRCYGCHVCLQACPHAAIALNERAGPR